jgi:hypothetical protein
MQRLYTYYEKSTNKPIFCIYTPTSRNYRCYTITDPDLYKPITWITDCIIPSDAVLLLEAPQITLRLIQAKLPELLI